MNIVRPLRVALMTLMALSLTACLDVQQHPAWVHGTYAGKPDDIPSQRHYHGDRLAWNAAIDNRNRRQNEYNRMR